MISPLLELVSILKVHLIVSESFEKTKFRWWWLWCRQSSIHASIQKPQKHFVMMTKICSYFYAQLWPNVSIEHSSDGLFCHFFHLICLYARQIHLISKVNHFTEVIILFVTLEKWLSKLNHGWTKFKKTLAITKMLLSFK